MVFIETWSLYTQVSLLLIQLLIGQTCNSQTVNVTVSPNEAATMCVMEEWLESIRVLPATDLISS